MLAKELAWVGWHSPVCRILPIAGKDYIGKITVNKLDTDRILLDRATSCCDGGGA